MFKKAVPVFATGLKDEMNVLLGFYARIPKRENAVLRLTGSAQYKVYVGGVQVHFGPARTCHGKYKVDEISLGKYLTAESNPVVIRLLSPNAYSFSTLKAEGFLLSEIEADGEILAFTGRDGGFSCAVLEEHIQKTLRYSFQRPFTEVSVLTEERGNFNTEPEKSGYPLAEIEELGQKSLLKRDVFYPEFPAERAKTLLKKGSISVDIMNKNTKAPSERNLYPTETFTCFEYGDIECNLLEEYSIMNFTVTEEGTFPAENFTVGENRFVILDLGRELTGFMDLKVEAVENSEIYVIFDEVMNGETLDPYRLDCINIVKFRLNKGKFKIQTEEPYSYRYMQICVTEGEVKVSEAGLTRVGFGEIDVKLNSENEAELKIFDAAVETFRQNTFDIFMDCPSRERAGWLCDSLFTARTEYILTNKNEIERAFLCNYLHTDEYPFLPKGMLPMCFPSDHPNGGFIPNWAMFYAVELEEHCKRNGGGEDLKAAAKGHMEALCEYFEAFENEHGLLENLKSWIMVEWSRANGFVQDVNHPTNALYAAMLDSLGRLYSRQDLCQKAEKIRAYIRENAMYNGFFCDNSMRKEDGKLHLSGECTEVCQYYMFFFGVATPELYPELWRILTEDFGPRRKENNKYPQIYDANSFVGNYMRLDILFNRGLHEKVLEEICGYFLYMAEKTGTLWEHVSDNASCNHGFASYVAYWLLRIRNGI